KSAYARLQSIVSGTADSVRSFRAELKVLNSEIEQQETILRRLRRDLGIAKDLAGSADIFAAVGGTVRTVNVYKSQHLVRAQMAVDIEEDAARQVHAWLPEAQFGAVKPGMVVNMDLITSNGPSSVRGVITNLTGLRDPMISDEFGLHVIVDVNTKSLLHNRQLLLPDAPVQATAMRSVGAGMAGGSFNDS
ncbi:MAG: HlyD family efflux transporter periplasmic adaptor subunit, partial [Planktomarina sp.]